MVTPGGHPEVSPPFAEPLPGLVVVAGVVVPAGVLPVVVVVPLELPLVLLEEPAADADFSSEPETATPMPMSPFMPAAACPLTVQRNSYLPVLEIVTVSVAESPWCSSFVVLPEQELLARLALATGFEQIRKLWNATPWFVTLKVIEPGFTIEVFDSLNASSEGLPAVTVTVVGTACGFAVACAAAVRWCAAGASAATTAAITATATKAPTGTVNRLGKRLIGCMP